VSNLKKISDFSSAPVFNGTELFELVRGGVNYKAALSAISAYVLPSTYPGQNSITTVGIVTGGTWSGAFAPRVNVVSTATSLSLNPAAFDVYAVSSLSSNLSTNIQIIPTPNSGQKIELRIKDNGTPKTLTFGSNVIFTGVTNPGTTIAGQVVYFEFEYNIVTNKWDCIRCTDSSGAVTSVNGYTGAVSLTYTDVNAAPLASPVFTGVPTAPTASPGTNTTQLATTAFVLANPGTPALTSTYVGYGDGSNLLTGSSNFAYASSKLTIQRSTTGGAIMATNNSYNLNGDAPIVIQDGSGYNISFGYTTTSSSAYMYATSSGLYLNAAYAIGALKYGVYIEGGTGLCVSGKTRLGDSNFNTGETLEVAGTAVVSTGIYAGGITTPTAKIHVAAGTTTAGTAPVKLTTGTALTTPEDGSLEYHSSHLYFTIGSTRKQLDGVEIINGDPGRINVSGTSTVSVSLDGTFVGSIGYLASNNSWSGTNTFNQVVTFGGTNSINIGARNITLDTTTGTRIGTSNSQKLAFYGATARIQPTNSITGPGITSGGGTPLNTLDSANGYTFDKLVAALQSLGLIA
jgi:hypothetical protein